MFSRPRFDVITVGSATRDFMFYDQQGKLSPATTATPGLCFPYGAKIDIGQAAFTFGGGAANAAANAAAQGWRTAILTAVGGDETGTAIIKNMQQRGVQTQLIERQAQTQSSFSFIITAGSQREHVIFLYRGAAALLQARAAAHRRASTRWWYVTSLVGRHWRPVLQTVWHRPGAKAWNPGSLQLQAGMTALAPYLAATDVLFLNRQEALTVLRLTGAVPVRTLLRRLHRSGPRVVVITSGKQGADATTGQNFFHQAITSRRPPVDTTGVGDAHNSTFMTVFDATGGDCAASLRAAAKNAAAVAGTIGAQEGFVRIR